MTILQALVRAYERMPDAPRQGFAMQRIGVVIGLNRDGSIATVSSLHDRIGKKRVARSMAVPSPVKRASNVVPNTFWDKTAYVLGVSGSPKPRNSIEHAAFIDHHRALIGQNADPGLKALLRFLDGWSLERFEADGRFTPDMLDENVIFALEEERLGDVYLHDRPAARELLEGCVPDGEGEICLVTGRRAPIARLHPSIKGVWGSQTAGASIVSFNLDAFESYGHSQGRNAPVSETAAAAYTGALNRYLERDSGHRVQIGDASTVFWAEAESAAAASLCEDVFGAMFADPSLEDEAAARRLGDRLEQIRIGRPLAEVDPVLAEGVRFFVLGLAPNAARISIRFWLDTGFGELARTYARYSAEMAIEPPDRRATPALWQYLRETAVLGKAENVPPNLAGEWMRAILTGAPFPLTLLATVLRRIRADRFVNARRASILKAVLIRNFRVEASVALDPDNRSKGYLLGRLFAVYEQAQSAALGRGINATIKDKFYGAASSQPRKVFAMLDARSVNHLSKVGKAQPGQRVNLEKKIAAIMDAMTPSGDPFPATLAAAEQALFGLGYYHERNAFFALHEAANEETDARA